MARKKKPTVGQQIIRALNEFIESGELQKLLEKLPPNPPKVKVKSLPARPKADDKPPKKGQFELDGDKAQAALYEWAWEVLDTGEEHSHRQSTACDAYDHARNGDDFLGWAAVVEWMKHIAWLADVLGVTRVEVSPTGFTELILGTRGQKVQLLAKHCEHYYKNSWLLKVHYDYGKDAPGNESVVFIDKLLKIKGN